MSGVQKRIFKPYGKLSDLRTAVRNYDECQRDVVRAKNRLLAAFRMRGIRLPKDCNEEDRRDELLTLLKEPYARHAKALCTRLDAALEAREEARTWLGVFSPPLRSGNDSVGPASSVASGWPVVFRIR